MQEASLLEGMAVQIIEKGDLLFQHYNALTRPTLDILHGAFSSLFYGFLFILGAISTVYFLTAIYVSVRKNEPYIEQPRTATPFVTIQIPTRNELAAIRCAKKCLAFEYPKDRYEILLGDDSDKPEVSAAIATFAARHQRIKVFRRKINAGYKAGNLNNLLKHSRGKYLVLFDSDFMPEPDFLSRIIAPMIEDASIAGTQARWRFINTEQNLISILGAGIGSVFHYVALPFFNKRRRLSVLCGSAEAVRKDVLVKLGGWKHGSLTEDIEYSIRLLKNGMKIQYLPDLECKSELPYRPRDLYRQQMRWAYGVISAIKAHCTTLFGSKKLQWEDKLLVFYLFSGYLLSTSLFLVLTFGVLSVLTHTPEAIDFSRFFVETGRNILFTSGLLLTSAYSLWKSGSVKKTGHLVIASFSYGLIVTYYVNRGIFRVLIGREMHWFLLQKKGNKELT